MAADHIYRMDYRPMLNRHRSSDAELTIATAVVSRAEARGFGIIDADADGRIWNFLEKPTDPPAMPGHPERFLASMGIYIFRWSALRAALLRDREMADSRHDFGLDIVPEFVANGQATSYRFKSLISGRNDAYWRDVGTLDAYRMAHLELLVPESPLQLMEAIWPTLPQKGEPLAHPGARLRDTHLSFIAASSAIGQNVRLDNSVVLTRAQVGADSGLRNCILGPDAVLDPGTIIGEDPAEGARWFRRSPGGTVLVTAAMLKQRRAQLPAHTRANSVRARTTGDFPL